SIIGTISPATAALDKTTEQNIMDTILSLKDKLTILMITHNKHLIKFCDKTYLLNEGKIIHEL
ncbi:MAG: hypothetical protein AAF403_05320, partial [Pseudomonadota bacterium]